MILNIFYFYGNKPNFYLMQFVIFSNWNLNAWLLSTDRSIICFLVHHMLALHQYIVFMHEMRVRWTWQQIVDLLKDSIPEKVSVHVYLRLIGFHSCAFNLEAINLCFWKRQKTEPQLGRKFHKQAFGDFLNMIFPSDFSWKVLAV